MTAPLPPLFVAPSRNRAAWESLVVSFGGLEWPAPGVVTINDADIEEPYDVKEAQGQDSATAESKGEKVQTFQSVHWLSDEPPPPGTYAPVEGVDIVDDHIQWGVFQWVLRSIMLGKKAAPVRHPKLELKEIDSGIPTKIAGPDAADDGSTTFTVDWLAYSPVKKKPGGGLGGGDPQDKLDGRTDADDAIDQRVKTIEELQDEWEEL